MARKKSSSRRKPIKIKRPGALTARAKRSGRSVSAQAARDKKSGTPLQKKQAAFYFNIAKKGKGGGRKKKASSGRRRKSTGR